MEFPKRARYKRRKDRIYFLGDFEDGEEIEFAYFPDKPSAKAVGNAFYSGLNEKWRVNLVNIKDLEEIR